MPFASCYIEPDNKHEISQSGFNEFPYVVPRYLKASFEIYGRSPAMTALPDVSFDLLCYLTGSVSDNEICESWR